MKGKETFKVWRTPIQRQKPTTRANGPDTIPSSNATKEGNQKWRKKALPSPRGMKSTVESDSKQLKALEVEKDVTAKKRAKRGSKKLKETVVVGGIGRGRKTPKLLRKG